MSTTGRFMMVDGYDNDYDDEEGRGGDNDKDDTGSVKIIDNCRRAKMWWCRKETMSPSHAGDQNSELPKKLW